MTRSTDPLVVGRVVGDVLDPFTASVELIVKYETRQVSNGCELKPSATAEVPKVFVAGRNNSDSLFTLGFHVEGKIVPVLITADIADSKLKEWRGTAVTNFQQVMADPDAPSPSEPTMREWLQWLVTDIPGGTDVSQGRQIVPYSSPKPTIGIHRFVFVLFKQQNPLSLAPPAGRHKFSTRSFALEHELGLPVAAVYYNAQKETGAARRR